MVNTHQDVQNTLKEAFEDDSRSSPAGELRDLLEIITVNK
jgi:hypothetical protein